MESVNPSCSRRITFKTSNSAEIIFRKCLGFVNPLQGEDSCMQAEKAPVVGTDYPGNYREM